MIASVALYNTTDPEHPFNARCITIATEIAVIEGRDFALYAALTRPLNVFVTLTRKELSSHVRLAWTNLTIPSLTCLKGGFSDGYRVRQQMSYGSAVEGCILKEKVIQRHPAVQYQSQVLEHHSHLEVSKQSPQNTSKPCSNSARERRSHQRKPQPPKYQTTFSRKSNMTGLVARKLSRSSNFPHHPSSSGYCSFHLMSPNSVSTISIIPSIDPAAISAMVSSPPTRKSPVLAFTNPSIAPMAPYTFRSCRAIHSSDFRSPRDVSKNARPCFIQLNLKSHQSNPLLNATPPPPPPPPHKSSKKLKRGGRKIHTIASHPPSASTCTCLALNASSAPSGINLGPCPAYFCTMYSCMNQDS